MDGFHAFIDPHNPESILILADWLEEQGRYAEAAALRSGALLPEMGYGYGYGSGYGSGAGDGSGSGDAYWDEYGDGFGDPQKLVGDTTMEELEIGQAYLWMVGHGWMFLGRFVRRDGLFGVVVADLVNVCRTGGTPWDDLCRGKGREQATFRRWDPATPAGTPFPYAVPLGKWVGSIPQSASSRS